MSLKAAVIGVGYLGRHHARIFSSVEGATLHGVVDSSEDARNAIAGEYGATAYADYRDVLDKVDVVSIVTPTIYHYDIAMECLRAGKDILLEKPITATVEQADALIDEAERLGRIIQVGHLERYNPAVVALGNLVNKPAFIEAERVSPFLGRGVDVDITLDLMIHDIDIVTSLVGSPIKDIRVVGTRMLTENLDAVKAWIEFENGTSALVTASRMAAEKRRILKVHQEGAFLLLDYQNMKIMRHYKSGEAIAVEEISIEQKEPLREEIEDFIKCVKERRRPRVSAVEGRNALGIALKISEQIRKAE